MLTTRIWSAGTCVMISVCCMGQVCKKAMDPEKYDKYHKKQMSKRPHYAKVSHMIMIGMKRQANPEKLMPQWEEQCATACAVQNIYLMATALGLGGAPILCITCTCLRLRASNRAIR